MSAANTPSRSRGMPVPGIDTRGVFEGHQPSPRGPPISSNSWPMTPPQSALEDRRPSLAYSSISDASTSGPSSACGYSQPATPVHSLGHSNDQFANSCYADATMVASIPDHCSLGQTTQAMYNSSLVHPMSAIEMTSYSPARNLDSVNAFTQSPMRHAWTHANQSNINFDSGLKTTLFQTTQALGQSIDHDAMSTASMYGNPASSIHHPSLGPAFQVYSNVASSYSSTVVPSQVTHEEDYTMDHCPGYDANDPVAEEFSSFDSSATGYSNGWELVAPQSPDGPYCVPSEDEDYMHVKHERTPGPHPSLNGLSPHGGHRRQRRSRKSLHTSHLLGERDCHGILVRREGKEWDYVNGRAVAKHSDDSKLLRCTWKDNGKCCDAKFTRSEHLKRHMTKHSNDKPYPCPLEGCAKMMSRPDNAGDHFKTHLKGPAKGKRNKGCSLEELADAMRADQRWDDKKTSKMLTNLEKWLPDWKIHQEETRLSESLGFSKSGRSKAHEHEIKAQAETWSTTGAVCGSVRSFHGR